MMEENALAALVLCLLVGRFKRDTNDAKSSGLDCTMNRSYEALPEKAV